MLLIYSNFSLAHNKLKGERKEKTNSRRVRQTQSKKAVGNETLHHKLDKSPAEHKEHMYGQI